MRKKNKQKKTKRRYLLFNLWLIFEFKLLHSFHKYSFCGYKMILWPIKMANLRWNLLTISSFFFRIMHFVDLHSLSTSSFSLFFFNILFSTLSHICDNLNNWLSGLFQNRQIILKFPSSSFGIPRVEWRLKNFTIFYQLIWNWREPNDRHLIASKNTICKSKLLRLTILTGCVAL